MRIQVRVKTGAKNTSVECLTPITLGFDDPTPLVYKVSVNELPVEGKANAAIARALAEYFDISISRVVLVSGGHAKRKLFDIQG